MNRFSRRVQDFAGLVRLVIQRAAKEPVPERKAAMHEVASRGEEMLRNGSCLDKTKSATYFSDVLSAIRSQK